MRTISTNRPTIDQSIITSAVEHLRAGELVAFPTETVYGLGADATNEAALRKLYTLKGRPSDHPVIVHLANSEQIYDWGTELSDCAKTLAHHFWPGPLTLIVKKSSRVSSLVTGGQDTVGLRVPAHPIALALLEAFDGGIAAPSANKYGRISSTCAQHVRNEFGDQVSLVIDGGRCPVGIESTIVDMTASVPRILRPGMISKKQILECWGLDDSLQKAGAVQTGAAEEYIRVPGSDKTHYAPQTPLFVVDKDRIRALLSEASVPCAVMAFEQLDQLANGHAKNSVRHYIKMSDVPESYAQDLYSNLHKLDACGANRILVEAVPESIKWLAIADRLSRAASGLLI